MQTRITCPLPYEAVPLNAQCDPKPRSKLKVQQKWSLHITGICVCAVHVSISISFLYTYIYLWHYSFSIFFYLCLFFNIPTKPPNACQKDNKRISKQTKVECYLDALDSPLQLAQATIEMDRYTEGVVDRALGPLAWDDGIQSRIHFKSVHLYRTR